MSSRKIRSPLLDVISLSHSVLKLYPLSILECCHSRDPDVRLEVYLNQSSLYTLSFAGELSSNLIYTISCSSA